MSTSVSITEEISEWGKLFQTYFNPVNKAFQLSDSKSLRNIRDHLKTIQSMVKILT
jgi:hypothetical protein